MYLNVNLTPPPPSAGEGSCTTPKTPEILNSLINLTSPPLPQSYSQYQSQVEGGTLLSPMSDLSSPCEESAAIPITAACTSRLESSSCVMSSQLTEQLQSPTSTGFPSIGVGGCGGGGGIGGSGGGGGLVGGSPGTSGTGGPLAGASPPSTPDLPSPVTTMEATKTALIKEGLKHQIKSKLQAAGVENNEPFYGDSKYIKNETDELTEEDEERRRKRRERNKIAATKCRNKKKEKTIVLMTESESVEDMNVRLKTEIQRLTSEKMKLEKLLGDPNHRASCRHSPRCTKAPKLPLVIVTPADSPDASSSSSSSSSTSSSSSSSSSESPTSPPLTGPISYKATHSQASTVMASHPGNNTPSSNLSSCASTSSSQFLAPKYNSSQNQRHHPYQYSSRQLQPHCSPGMAEKPQYCSPPSPSGCLPKMGYNYQCMNVPRTHEFTPPNPPSMKSVYTSAKSRGNSVRYNPYSGRPPPVLSPLATHTHPQPGAMCGDIYHNNNNNNGCRREDQQTCISDTHANQFFPPCSYSSM